MATRGELPRICISGLEKRVDEAFGVSEVLTIHRASIREVVDHGARFDLRFSDVHSASVCSDVEKQRNQSSG